MTQYAYDQALRKTSETTPNNEIVNFTYDAGGNLLTLQDHRGKTTTWTYDTEGRMRTKRYQGQAFANLEHTYNPNGQVATRRFWSSPSASRVTTYTYDNAGNLTLVDYPVGTQDITIAYDALDRVSSMTDASGTTGYTYRDLGVLATENSPWANDTVTYTYNTAGLRSQLQLQQPTGNWTQNYLYDASRRLSTITSPALSANPFLYAYSGTGRRVSRVTFPTSAYVGKDYDTLGRLTATYLKRQDGTDLNRDAYPLYNARHQITRHTRTDTTYVNFGYDNLGQLTSAVGNGGQSTENLGYAYDGGWNMNQRTSGGTPVNYTINDRNQVTSGPVGNNNYDANGNRTSQTYDASGPKTYNYAYDDENQLTSAATDTYYTPAGSRWKTAFTYDGRGRLRVRKDYTWTGGTPLVSGVGSLGTRKASVPAIGERLAIGVHDGVVLSRLSNVMDAAGIEKLSANPFVYAYSGTGRRVSRMTFPTSAYVGKDYDTLGRLTATYLKRQDGTDLNRDAYPIYNNRHQITRHTRTDASYVNFGYDNLGQLTSAVGSGGQSTENLGYAYDGGWNMTQRTSGGTPVNYGIDDRNQVISGPVGSNSYDANGNRTSQTYDASGPKTYSYTYDDENQLTSAGTDTYYTPVGSRWKTAFTYDGRGRLRVREDYTWTGGTPLVSSVTSLGTLRNNWAGYVGFQFTVGGTALDRAGVSPGN
jgi:YD repeat-containing protein